MKALSNKSIFLMALFVFSFLLTAVAFGQDITISSNTTWNAGTYTYENVWITNGATLIFNGSVTLNAATLTVDSGSSISANGKGYPEETGPGAGKLKGCGGSGAGHGGKGGVASSSGCNPDLTSGGLPYGSAFAPTDLGSGGGSWPWYGSHGGSGGGAITLNVSGTLTVKGIITANGSSGGGSYGGGGSGGSIYVATTNLTGSGSFTANGGVSTGNGGAGGGGRIAVYYENSDFSGKADAKGGTARSDEMVGKDGTVGFIDRSNNILNIISTFRFQGNDSPMDFNEVILNSAKVNFEANAILSANKLTLAESIMTLTGSEVININEVIVSNNSVITHFQEGKVNLKVSNLTIEFGSSISADGKGYPAESGPGAGQRGCAGSGAGYGGRGGMGSSSGCSPDTPGGSAYGSAFAPTDLGSGGGSYPWYGSVGGSGGGAIILNIANTLTINGAITANGGNVGLGWAGGGSGGSIYIVTANLTGSGSLTANGGNSTSRGGAGGGGRIAIYFENSDFIGNAEAKGGTATSDVRVGEDGTFVSGNILAVVPQKSGNFGSVSVHIAAATSGVFVEGTSVRLVRDGEADIAGDPVALEENGQIISTMFNLSGQMPGLWDVVVTLPDNRRITCEDCFTIESGGASKLWVEIYGRDKIRIGREQTYEVLIGNSGNLDSLCPFFWLEHSPGIEIVEIRGHDNNILWPESMDGSDSTSLSDTTSSIVAVIGLPTIKAKAQSIAPHSLKVKVRTTTPPNFDRVSITVGTYSLTFLTGLVDLEGYLAKLLNRKTEEYGGDISNYYEFESLLLDSLADYWKEWWEHPVENLFHRFIDELGSAVAGAMKERAGELFDIDPEKARRLFQLADAYEIGTDAAAVAMSELPALALENLKKTWPKAVSLLGAKKLLAVTSISPEDKYGPSGYDPEGALQENLKRYVSGDSPMLYKIDFWNKEDAPAPTQDVIITDQLDTDLDWDSFSFTEFGFLKWQVKLADGKYFNIDVDLRPDNNLIVNAQGTFDPDTGEVRWEFHSLDPSTNEPPEDPMAGFLPPITDTGYEIGWVTFNVNPKEGLPTGSQITNQAWVKFDVDVFKPAPPNPDSEIPGYGPYLNTIDALSPSSNVLPLPGTQTVSDFNVSWSGSDDTGGSGIRNYDIYVSDNGGPYTVWLTTTETSANFTGVNGHQYLFYSRARDNVGNIEDAPTQADTITEVMVDVDGDGIPDDTDNCVSIANQDQADSDNDGVGNACDSCPNDPSKVIPGICGCGVADTDSDNDGTPNCNDGCSDDLNKTQPGVCGCGMTETDSDSDGTPDCIDGCPTDSNKIDPGICGCEVADTDTDNDGTPDCTDGCPNDPNKIALGTCGCGVADTDSDNDGIADCKDNCINTYNPEQLDSNGNGIGDACDFKEICSYLGNNPKPLIPDIDIFQFSGTNGETVIIRIESTNPPEAGTGKRVALILTDKIKGTVLVKLDRSDLPNEITAKLPATGEYLITVAQPILIAKDKRYSGQYCLTLKASLGTYQTLAPALWVE
jgi:hypothetical protein